MRINDFDVYAALLMEKSGLTIMPDKSYMIESRLLPVAREWGYNSMDSLTMALNGVPDPGLVRDVIEAMMTHDTSFFRDIIPFKAFANTIIPYIQQHKKGGKFIRIWSAGCSSGQEPYSIAMQMQDMAKELGGWDYSVLATDIDHTILQKAAQGEYTQAEVQYGLPIKMLLNYFEHVDDAWRLLDLIVDKVDFQYFNMLDSMGPVGDFDIIFFRNVLTYFDKDIAKSTLEKIARQMPDDGFLIVGRDENISEWTNSFAPLPGAPCVYVPKGHKLAG